MLEGMRIRFANPPADELPKIAFLDFEGASLYADSFPIEIGWCGVDASKPCSLLIQIHESWRKRTWSPDAQDVHKISPEMLAARGAPAAEVWAVAKAWLGRARVFSDAPSWEQHWLNELATAAGERCAIRVSAVEELWGSIARQRRMEPNKLLALIGQARQTFKAPHRAGPDAARLSRITRFISDAQYREGVLGSLGTKRAPIQLGLFDAPT